MKSRHGFTLIELLVGIGIIMLLAALMMGGLQAASRRAKKARARRDVSQINTAWKVYYADYGRFPDASFSGEVGITIKEMGAEAIQILRGSSGDPNYDDPDLQSKNPRGQEYMDFHKAVTTFLDPWKNPYQIILDEQLYDGKITVHNPTTGGNEDIRYSVAVYSKGPDGVAETADDVCSWRDR